MWNNYLRYLVEKIMIITMSYEINLGVAMRVDWSITFTV